jgi:hypothetical protein
MITLLLAATAAGLELPACSRLAPEPQGFHARGFGYVAEVFPPKSRHNASARPVVHFFSVNYAGHDWRVDAQRRWTATLPHESMPQAALVSMEGHVVTLDDYHQAGAVHALAIIDRGGRFVRSYALEELLEPAALALVPQSDCGRLWREGARFFFTGPANPTLYVLLSSQRVLQVALSTGELRRGGVSDYPELAEILSRSHPNEEAEIRALSLRFSSLSDFVPKN